MTTTSCAPERASGGGRWAADEDDPVGQRGTAQPAVGGVMLLSAPTNSSFVDQVVSYVGRAASWPGGSELLYDDFEL